MKNLNYRLPKTKVGERSFKKIIKAGKVLFAKDGYQSTSINHIIAKAKVAAGTFYIYFDNKLALYMYLLEEYRITIRDSAFSATKDYKTRVEIERQGLRAFIEYAKKDPLSYKIIWESLFVDYKIFKDYYYSFAQSYIHHLKTHVKTGEVRDDIDLETLSYVLMGISNFVGLQIIFKDDADEVDIDFVVDETMKILKNGMFKK
jgi:AcrR family transcriptional regulator